MLRRLSVFVGGFELEAAEAVCQGDDVDAFDVVDLVGSLVDKSLVVADRADGSVRYRLLETIRQYSAQELLTRGGEEEVLRARERHAAFFLSLAESAGPELAGPRQAAWLKRLDPDSDNFRAVFAALGAEPGRADDVLRLGVALQRLVVSRGHIEVVEYLREALELAGETPLLADALVSASLLTVFLLGQKDAVGREAGRVLAERALATSQEVGDEHAHARALALLSGVAHLERGAEVARQLALDGVEIARRLDDTQLLGELLRCVAILGSSWDERHRLHQEALACFRKTGDVLFAAGELYALVGLEADRGSLAGARGYL